MPVYEFECERGHRSSELVGMTMEEADLALCPCGLPRRRLVSLAIGRIPDHMSDAGIEMTRRQREWLKTPEAKAMDLDPIVGDPVEREPKPAEGTFDTDGFYRDLCSAEIATGSREQAMENVSKGYGIEITPEKIAQRCDMDRGAA